MIKAWFVPRTRFELPDHTVKRAKEQSLEAASVFEKNKNLWQTTVGWQTSLSVLRDDIGWMERQQATS